LPYVRCMACYAALIRDAPSDQACGVGIYPVDAVQPLNVNVPANGQSTTVVLDGIIGMASIAPESCANTVFEVPIVSLVGNRV
jgi:hypothetical protein